MATIRRLRKRWQAMVRRKGVPPRARSFDRRNDAERWAREIEAEADRSGWVADTRLAEKTTLGELLSRYCLEISPSKRGCASELARMGAIIRRPICHRTLSRLTSRDLAQYRDERLGCVAPATIVRELNTISHAIDIAVREWGFWLSSNPVKSVRRPRTPRGRNRRLLPGEEIKLLAACDSRGANLIKPLIALALESGMRRGELVALRWRDVDLVERVARVELTKNGEPRDVPLSRKAVDILSELDQRTDRHPDHVFPVSGNTVRLAFERARGRAGMFDFHFHDLRHEAISRFFEKGLNTMEVGAISGHKELRMLARYSHLRARDLAAKLD